jgi:hypothetical protein
MGKNKSLVHSTVPAHCIFIKRTLILHLIQGTWFLGVREDFQQIVIVGLLITLKSFRSALLVVKCDVKRNT